MTLTHEERLTMEALDGGWDITGRGYTHGLASCLARGLIEPYTAYRVTTEGRKHVPEPVYRGDDQ